MEKVQPESHSTAKDPGRNMNPSAGGAEEWTPYDRLFLDQRKLKSKYS